ncbi:MAG: glycine--tRNA ligase, partial [Candidatus Omnitrophica bacterium]|nr:glycine--tRNA ligase [Candidatus Omnitrophota bacterium]
MDRIVSLCKRRGFIFQSSEIYGGLANAWDYGPLGSELKRNVKNAWWRCVVHQRDDMVGLDAAILMHPNTWKASGHAENFTDLLVDDKETKRRYRYDHMSEEERAKIGTRYTEPREFNLMLKTALGAVDDTSAEVFLRPETAQGIFVNFKNVLDSTSRRLPFGIAQIGKSFRNEITAGNFVFRMREFEQMEIEYFTTAEESDACYRRWIDERFSWYVNHGIRKENLQLRPHGEDELAHYAKGCTDVEYKFPFGWSELEGIANRTDFDRKQHAELSGKDLRYHD